MPHLRRDAFDPASPLQITLRFASGLPSLRGRIAWAVIVRVLRAMRGASGFRIVEYSVQSNHMHLVVEADDAAALRSGMHGLTARLALRLNRALGRTGPLFADRFHSRSLGSPREVWLSLQYVLLDHRKHAAEHGQRLPPTWIDPRSSGPRFLGWREPMQPPSGADYGTSAPKTWLLAHGWRQCGPLQTDAVPGPERPSGDSSRASRSAPTRRR